MFVYLSHNIWFLPVFLTNAEVLYAVGEENELYSFITALNSLSGEKMQTWQEMHTLKSRNIQR